MGKNFAFIPNNYNFCVISFRLEIQKYFPTTSQFQFHETNKKIKNDTKQLISNMETIYKS